MEYTREQQAIIGTARATRQGGLKVVAYAGSGKTTTLKGIAGARPDGGLYLAFNRSTKEAATQSFPRDVRCMTPHGVAYAAMDMRSHKDRLVPRFRPSEVSRRMGVSGGDLGPATVVTNMALQIVEAFCRSLDGEITERQIDGAGLRVPSPVDRQRLLHLARKIWDDASGPSGPLTHDVYLKQFHLSGKPIPGRVDYILFDEAQDADGLMLDIVSRQGAPIFFVGDRHQQLYAFRGAVNAMDRISLPALSLCQSFRFGSAVAHVANWLLGLKHSPAEHMIIGSPFRQTVVEPSLPSCGHTVLCRTNAGVLDSAARTTEAIHIIGGYEETAALARAAYGLWTGERQTFGVLAAFPTWADLAVYQAEVHDQELTFLVRMVETYGTQLPAVLDAINRRHTNNPAAARIVLSTVHKAKGAEYPVVVLGEDFPVLDDAFRRDMPDKFDEEINILYVAATRPLDALMVNSTLLEMSRTEFLLSRPGACRSASASDGRP
ncbi:MAG: UvrD-helicase domain-containing protein [Alphaproteobacteria bacterium]|nr:UvrD-helicase domain-containing protein [Alphaproteobacteria bacterium]